MTVSNPWYWGSLSRQQFESTLQRDAVLLKLKDDRHTPTKPFIQPKVDIEAVRARKNALIAKGLIKPTVDIAAVKARKNAALAKASNAVK